MDEKRRKRTGRGERREKKGDQREERGVERRGVERLERRERIKVFVSSLEKIEMFMVT